MGASLGKHVSEWKPEDEDYVTAHEQRRLHAEEPIRTQDEQESDLYSKICGPLVLLDPRRK
jgi:hypothetical protein